MKAEVVPDYFRSLFKLLGSMNDRRYQGLAGACAIVASILVYVLAVEPMMSWYRERQRAAGELAEYRARKVELLAQIDRTFKNEQRMARLVEETTGPSELVLKFIHRAAARAGVVIVDFVRAATSSVDVLGGRVEICFTVTGAFSALNQFIQILSEDRTQFVVSMAVENVKWPDFDGVLRARVVVSAGSAS